MILKVVMSPHDPHQGFIDNCLKLLPETDVVEFQKILEMKVGHEDSLMPDGHFLY